MNEGITTTPALQHSGSPPVSITLQPLGRTLTVERGTPLRDVLFAQGVEFPCGGRGRCKGCRVKVLAGKLPVTADDARLLSGHELGEGWRLSCQATAESDLSLDLAQWEATILADHSTFDFTPRDGLGVAIDLGTTTLVGQLLDLRTGHVLAVGTGLNAQALHGADIMSRIDYAVHRGGKPVLEKLIREQIGKLIGELLAAASAPPGALRDVVLVGNTAMHHLFCGLDLTPLSAHPFEPETDEVQVFTARELGWCQPAGASEGRVSQNDGRGGQPCPQHAEPAASTRARGAMDGGHGCPPLQKNRAVAGAPAIAPHTKVHFLPGLGSFVGSDLLAGVLATRMHEDAALTVLVDLGTNGEIVVGNRERLLCASTAAGPAFEGARISCGMRAATGAISEVNIVENRLHCRVLGHVAPRGICGSGLVDAIACGLDLGWVQPDGKLTNRGELPLAPSVSLLQADLRELQLAKGAIAAGIRILLQQWGATPADVERVWLAGAFGNYINRASARRIGLINFPPEKVFPAGNTALLGAKLALFNLPSEAGTYPALRARTRHVPLNEDPQFMDIYVDEMAFPARAPGLATSGAVDQPA